MHASGSFADLTQRQVPANTHPSELNMSKLRIYLADDHPLMREGIRSLVGSQKDLEIVGEAAGGRAALEGVTRRPVDVAVLDLSLPGLSSIQVAAQLQRIAPHIRVVMLTVHEDESYVRRAMEAGAAGFVLKRSAAHELLSAIRTVAAGGTFVDSAIASKSVNCLMPRPKGCRLTPGDGLSEREEEVLRLLARGYSNKEVAELMNVSVKSVETYRARAADKLGLKGRVDIVRWALERGWLNAV
jgi:DNA-binding NarL/FixJ family response regulator